MFDGSWPGWTLAQSGISATAGLLGVFAGAMMTSRNQKKERKNAHTRQQLQEFYSPMLGMRQEIAAKEESRRKINEMVNTTIEESKTNDSAEFDGLIFLTNGKLLEDFLPMTINSGRKKFSRSIGKC